jgi:two-component system NtrC family sensor kinase
MPLHRQAIHKSFKTIRCSINLILLYQRMLIVLPNEFKPGTFRSLLLYLLVLFSLNVSAQKQLKPHTDSLLTRLAAAKDDTNKTNLLLKLGNNYAAFKKIDSAFFYFQCALQLAEKLNWQTGVIKCDDDLAKCYYQLSNYSEAQKYGAKAVELSLKNKDYARTYLLASGVASALYRQNKTPQAISYLNSISGRFKNAGRIREVIDAYTEIAFYAYYESDFNTAINYMNKALALAGNDPNKYISPANVLYVATIYNYLHETDKARAILLKAEANYKHTGALADLAANYTGLADCALMEKNYSLAAVNYGKAAQLAERIKDNDVAGPSENGEGWSFFLMKKYDSAYIHTKRSLPFSKNDSGMLVRPLSTLGSIYREATGWIIKDAGLKPGQQYERSVELLTESINYGLAHHSEYEFTYGCMEELSKTYEKMHDYANAYKTYKAFITKTNHMDSLKNEKALLLKEAQANYSHQEDSLRYRENITNAQLKQKELQNYFFIGGLVALLILSVFIWSNFNNQRKSNKLLEEANGQLSEQREEITTQRDRLVETVSDLKAAQQQLIQSEKMASLGELTAGIAHEIQNPLNFVNNFSDVSIELIDELDEELDRGDVKEAKAMAFDLKQNLGKILHHGKRADSIVKGMLEHSRTSAGRKEPADLNKLADEYLRLVYHGLRAKDKTFNAELVTHFDPELPLVNVSQQEMGRVMLNLFNNAFYAVNQKTKAGGTAYQPEVLVVTASENGNIIIKVADNGIGIPDAIKNKIMQPFFTTKPTGEGTGLGLSLSYDIVVKGHSGKIDVQSTPGEGSEFTIQLPIS